MATHTPSEIFAGNLRKRREELRWSQEDLAAGCRTWGLDGFTRAAIAQIEGGRRRVSLDEAVVLAYLLQTPISPSASVPDLAFPSPEQWFSLLTTDPSTTLQIGSAKAAAWILRVPASNIADPGVALTARREEAMMEKIALLLGVSRDDVAATAVRMWGHGIIDERERRLANGTGDIRVRRGLITRQLVHELHFKGFAVERGEQAARELASLTEVELAERALAHPDAHQPFELDRARRVVNRSKKVNGPKKRRSAR